MAFFYIESDNHGTTWLTNAIIYRFRGLSPTATKISILRFLMKINKLNIQYFLVDAHASTRGTYPILIYTPLDFYLTRWRVFGDNPRFF